ncbi:MAG TPA: G1 family glutamic endopeptidase [Acidimicrobiales bacterium]|nr:G1 family glutamic endopeptidase [Acidimicrobiales bacterium]
MRTTVVAALAGALLALAAPGASGHPTPSARTAGLQPTPAARPARTTPLHHTLVRHGGAATAGRTNAVDSLNWSGYVDPAAAGQLVTAVSGRWVVPAAQLSPPGMSAAWAGIGGFNTPDLLQAGTTSNSAVFGAPQYYAWYELLPDSETLITGCSRDPNCTVNPGDSVAVQINSLGGSRWHIDISDDGHWSWSSVVTYHSSGASAEWILEAPSVLVGPTLLANVGSMIFDGDNRYRLDGRPRTMAQGNRVAIRLSFGGVIPTAAPSAIDAEGDGFRACSYGASCPPLNS